MPSISVQVPVPEADIGSVGSCSSSAFSIPSLMAILYSLMPLWSEEFFMYMPFQLYDAALSPISLLIRSSMLRPSTHSPIVMGLSQSYSTSDVLLPLGLLSLLGHLLISRYVPTVVRLRPGTSHVVSPWAMMYENGICDASGWDATLPMTIENGPMRAGHSVCAPLAVLLPRMSTPQCIGPIL